MRTYFYKKNHNDFVIMEDEDTATMDPTFYTTQRPLAGEDYQYFDDENNEWVIDAVSKALNKKKRDINSILQEISSRDYRALKAVKIASAENRPAETVLEELYPGEGRWYMQKMAEFNQLESEIDALEQG